MAKKRWKNLDGKFHGKKGDGNKIGIEGCRGF
jgi:hypothetical protein